MPSINMITPRRAEKKRLERDMRRLVVVILVELVFALGLGGWVATKIFTTRCEVADLDTKLAKCQPVVKQIQEYDSAAARLTPKLDLLNQAKTGTMRWYNTLDRMAQSIPPSTWLTRVSAAQPKEGEQTTLTIHGVAVSQEKVGETMLLLARHDGFSGIDLHFTQKAMLGLTQAVEFEVGATMKTEDDQAKGVTGDGPGQS